MSQELPDLKTLVAATNMVHFVRYHDGNLWYTVSYVAPGAPAIGYSPENDGTMEYSRSYFEFPVPISDIGNATFLARDKAILFMRYVRKHLITLKEAKEAQGGQT